MRDLDREGGGGDTPRMTLLAINESYWLYEGKEFLNQMLLGRGFFPRPVRCILFADAFALRGFLGPGVKITDFWGINPDIVARLRRESDLVEISADDIAGTPPGDSDGDGGG